MRFAAIIAAIGGSILFVAACAELYQRGGLYVGGGVEHRMTASHAVILMGWLLCVIVTALREQR